MVAMRRVSAMASAVTPRSAAQENRDRDDQFRPHQTGRPGKCCRRREWRTHLLLNLAGAGVELSHPPTGPAPLSPEPPSPTLVDAEPPVMARRRSASICCLVIPLRSSRGVRLMVSVALFTLPPVLEAKGSYPMPRHQWRCRWFFTWDFPRGASGASRYCAALGEGASRWQSRSWSGFG